MEKTPNMNKQNLLSKNPSVGLPTKNNGNQKFPLSVKKFSIQNQRQTNIENSFNYLTNLNTVNGLFLEKSFKLVKKEIFTNKNFSKKMRKKKFDELFSKMETYLEYQQTLNQDFISDLINDMELEPEHTENLFKDVEDIKKNIAMGSEKSSRNFTESDPNSWKKKLGSLSEDMNFSDTTSNLSVQSLSVEVGKRQGYEINVENFDLGLKEEGNFFPKKFIE